MIPSFGSLLEEGHAAKLSAPEDGGVLQESSLFEVLNKACRGLVEDLRVDVILRFKLTVTVPVQFAPACVSSV